MNVLAFLLMSYVSAFPVAAASVDSGANDAAWALSTRITADDGAPAAFSGDTSLSQSQYLRATFNFAVPSLSTIIGIQVDMEQAASTGSYCKDGTVQLLKGTSRVGDNKADSSNVWPNLTDTLKTYGGLDDLWGTTWAPSEINSTDFGVDVRAIPAATSSFSGTQNGRVDYVKITVNWETGGTAFYTYSPAGSIAGAGALQGAATYTYSPSGIISAEAGLSGSVTYTYTPAGVLAGAADLSGTATYTYSGTGDMTALAIMSGSATYTYSGSGILVNQGELSGTATYSYSGSAGLEATAALSGNATYTYSGSGTLTADGAMAGSVTYIFSPSATLGGLGDLAGTATYVYTGHGMFTVEPEKPLKYRSRPHVTLAGGQRANVR